MCNLVSNIVYKNYLGLHVGKEIVKNLKKPMGVVCSKTFPTKYFPIEKEFHPLCAQIYREQNHKNVSLKSDQTFNKQS